MSEWSLFSKREKLGTAPNDDDDDDELGAQPVLHPALHRLGERFKFVMLNCGTTEI